MVSLLKQSTHSLHYVSRESNLNPVGTTNFLAASSFCFCKLSKSNNKNSWILKRGQQWKPYFNFQTEELELLIFYQLIYQSPLYEHGQPN